MGLNVICEPARCLSSISRARISACELKQRERGSVLLPQILCTWISTCISTPSHLLTGDDEMELALSRRRNGNRERVRTQSRQGERHQSEVLCHSSTHDENIWATRGGDGCLLLWATVTLRILCRIMHSAVLCTAVHVCATFCCDFNERVGGWLCLIPSNPGGGKNTCETKGWGPQENVMWFGLSGLRRGRAGKRFY